MKTSALRKAAKRKARKTTRKARKTTRKKKR